MRGNSARESGTCSFSPPNLCHVYVFLILDFLTPKSTRHAYILILDFSFINNTKLLKSNQKIWPINKMWIWVQELQIYIHIFIIFKNVVAIVDKAVVTLSAFSFKDPFNLFLFKHHTSNSYHLRQKGLHTTNKQTKSPPKLFSRC